METIDDKRLLNLASYDFAGLVQCAEVRDKAVQALRKYGVGACGPPGFYGTMGMLAMLIVLQYLRC